ncbi:aminotransferase class IV [Corynebacterium nasicanis]|uniref:Aminotransferase class IV n=1 Tax=Corynebacterium nasicanis TaxID=1448267 RepID=A0ABW1QCE2_9CORY
MIYRWDGAELVECADPGTAPEVVDSWLVDDGEVVRRDLHASRFINSAHHLVGGSGDFGWGYFPGISEFLAAVHETVPSQGVWFPRIEVHGESMYLRIRPAPPLRTGTVLWVPPTPDPRRAPRVKGPDLQVLAELRAQAQTYGADDAVLWTRDGFVVEGAHSALAWWEGETLMFPEHEGQLPSVTAQATCEVLPTGTRPITVEELRTLPVWAGSALHGWTEVTGWVDAAGRYTRADEAPLSAAHVNGLLRR